MARKPLSADQRHRLYTYIINHDKQLVHVGPFLERHGFIKYKENNLIKSVERGGAIAYNALRFHLGKDCDMMYSWLRTLQQKYRWVWVRSTGQVVRRGFQQYNRLIECIEASPNPPENTFVGAEDVVNTYSPQRRPITFYQETMMRKSFSIYDIPVNDICSKLEGVIPSCQNKDTLLEAVIAGGSLAFNALVEATRVNVLHHPLPKYWYLDQALINHQIPEKFCYVWIWSNTGEIMIRGDKLYSNQYRCLQDGKSKKPQWDTLRGPNPPHPILCLESICQCYEHLPTEQSFPEGPCQCVRDQEPAETIVLSGHDMVTILPELKS